MRTYLPLLAFVLALNSCALKDKIDHNSFHGIWESSLLKIEHYDESGSYSHSEELTINSRLGFAKDRFNQFGIGEIPAFGTYLGVKNGKKPVLYFSASIDGMTPDEVGTVVKKNRKNLEIAFYDIAPNGYIKTIRTYVFKFLKKIKSDDIIDLGDSDLSNIKIRYNEQGTQVEIPYYNHSYDLNTSSGNYELQIEFFNNLSDNDYRYIEFVIRGNSSGITSGSFPFSLSSTANTYGEFWFKRTGNGNMTGSLSAAALSCSTIDVSSELLHITATCSQVGFAANPTGMTDNEITDIIIGD